MCFIYWNVNKFSVVMKRMLERFSPNLRGMWILLFHNCWFAYILSKSKGQGQMGQWPSKETGNTSFLSLIFFTFRHNVISIVVRHVLENGSFGFTSMFALFKGQGHKCPSKTYHNYKSLSKIKIHNFTKLLVRLSQNLTYWVSFSLNCARGNNLWWHRFSSLEREDPLI